MRLGKRQKKSRAWKKAGLWGKPKHVSPESVVGQVSLDLVSTVFAPKIKEVAKETLQKYAEDFMLFEEQLRDWNQTAEAQIGEDGSILAGQPVPPTAPLFGSQYRINEFSQDMAEVSDHFFSKKGGWKIHANAAKFERMLDEKYGVFRPFITNHPEVEQFLRSVQRKYAMGYFSPFRQGDPPIPRTTAVILLFMLRRGNLRWEILVLAAVFFLVGLQPWALVAIVAVLHQVLAKRKRRAVGTMKTKIPAVEPYYRRASDDLHPEDETKRKQELLLRPVGTPLDGKETIDSAAFDTILLGSGVSCLYTASLLSRAGRKVLVLSERSDASGCLTMKYMTDPKLLEKYEKIPFDVDASNISKITRQQEVLAPALSTTTDCQGGVRFAQIGSEADGYAFEILSIPGMGTEGTEQQIPFVLRAAGGLGGLMEDAATYLGDGWPGSKGEIGSSTTGGYVAACDSINATASLFYLSKILPESVNKLRSSSTYEESAIRYASSFLSKCFPLNVHTRSLMAGIGMKGENIKPSTTSTAAHITNICAALSGEGMHYPVGGPRALCHALANIVGQSGGRIVTDVLVHELLFAEQKDETKPASNAASDEGPPAPRCIGVKMADGREIRFGSDRYTDGQDFPVVVSMQGFMHTFLRLLPDEIRTKYKVPRGLPALCEQRPVFKILVVLKGSAEDLNVTGADFYRLPNAAIARDEVDSVTGAITYGEIGWPDEDTIESRAEEVGVENINEEPSSGDAGKLSGARQRKGRKSKFETGASWLHISFPSAKDPSFESRHGKITTCVITIEADDDFVTRFDTKPKLYVMNKATASAAGDLGRLQERARRDLVNLFPQVEGKIERGEIHGPFRRGLSHNPERYAAKGVRADTPYGGLFVGGSDLTVGESFSGSIVAGWLVANAVVGYSAVDHLFLKKNITSDLEQFLEPPTMSDEDDVAVPYAASLPSRAATVDNDNDSEQEES